MLLSSLRYYIHGSSPVNNLHSSTLLQKFEYQLLLKEAGKCKVGRERLTLIIRRPQPFRIALLISKCLQSKAQNIYSNYL